MIQDLHAHTYYSFCSDDTPERVIETAIRYLFFFLLSL